MDKLYSYDCIWVIKCIEYLNAVKAINIDDIEHLNLDHLRELARRLGFWKDAGEFFKRVGKAIVNTVKNIVSDVAQAIMDSVEWIADLVQDIPGLNRIFAAIADFVELVGQILTGDIDQFIGIDFRKKKQFFSFFGNKI